ncbi:Ankyrin repeat domain-containing protein 44 [Onygenales sp. PD_12]|nr:Ankyrin repeat domain-containing protein 44 [Onygenales sp. PD_12]
MKLTDLPQEILDEIFYLLYPRFKRHRLEISSVHPGARLVCKRFDTTIIDCFLRKIRKAESHFHKLVFNTAPVTRSKLLFVTRLLSQSVENAASRQTPGNCQLVNEILQAAEDAADLLIPEMSDRKAGSLKYRHGLIQAAMGEMDTYRTLIALRGFEIDDMPSKKMSMITPIERGIIAAASTGSVSDLQLLINPLGASPTYEHCHFGTPLRCAAFGGHEAVVRFLMNLEGVQLDSENKDGNAALNRAAIANDVNIVRLLLDGGAGIDFQYGAKETPLLLAVAFGYDSIVGLLVEKGANPNQTDRFEETTPLVWAATNGDEKVVRQLLKSASINVNFHGSEGTALSIAMEKDLPVIVDMLLRSPSMDMREWNRNYSMPLEWACREGHEAIVRLLLDNFKLSELETFETSIVNALSNAADSDRRGILRMLFESEYVNAKHLNSQGLDGGSALHNAAKLNNVETMEILLADVRVDPNARAISGRTPLATAAHEGRSEAVTLLLFRDDVDRNAVDKSGITPLGCACENNIPAIAEALLNDPLNDSRVQIHHRDENGLTPLMLAAEWGNNRVVEVLLRRERELNILTADNIRRAIKECRLGSFVQHREETLALLSAEMTRMGEDFDDEEVEAKLMTRMVN